MRIKSIRELYNVYQTFIFDIWGVIHNGHTLYPGALETFNDLRALNKTIAILSNAPRPNSIVYDKLIKLGLNVKLQEVVTSGGFFLNELQSNSQKIFHNLSGKALVIGEEKNQDLLRDVTINRTNNIEDADYILLLIFTDNSQDLSLLDETFKTALHLNLPVICPNPDKIVMDGAHIRYTAGTFANRYEEMGGKAYYFGKPHKEIYEYILEKLGNNSAIMVGDSLETDISGANRIGIDSLLLTSGLYKDKTDISSLLETYKASPTYIMDGLHNE